MGLDLLRRIRWGNVGRLAGAAALVAAVVAWPRLAPPEPALPERAARPLDGLGAAPVATPPPELLLATPPKLRGRPGGRPRRSHAKARREKSEEVRPGDGGRGVKRRRPRRTSARREPGSSAPRGAAPERAPAEPPPVGEGGGRPRDTAPAGEPSGGDPAETEFGFERG